MWMKHLSKMLLAGVAVLFFAMAIPEAHAGNPFKKLGRGVVNVAFGPLEICKQPVLIARAEGELAGITWGVFQGIGYCLAREGVGILDIITFPMPLPGCPDDPNDIGWGYGPIMQPEWIFTREQNPYNFFYNDEALQNF